MHWRLGLRIQRRDALLTPAELRFFGVLRTVIGTRAVVWAKVRLAGVAFVNAVFWAADGRAEARPYNGASIALTCAAKTFTTAPCRCNSPSTRRSGVLRMTRR
jgi:hypothetical protein